MIFELVNIGEDRELLKELREITKNKGNWNVVINEVAAKLNENHSDDVKAKVLWLLGEMGLNHPLEVKKHVADIASYLHDDCYKLRERSVNALGRIGRADKHLIVPYLDKIMEMRKDNVDEVRLAFVWACENIATNAPDLYSDYMDIFLELINDKNDRVRIEAPEMFRVIGKRKPKYVEPYLDKLQWFADNDLHRVVRIHSAGAVRVTKKALEATKNINE